MELAITPAPTFDKYRKALVSQPLSAIWRGHGSAIFLEFGKLQPPRMRRDGSAANARGRYSVMIEWSWRIEAETSIVCGSWSDEKNWAGVFGSLIGRTVEDVALHGRLPELAIALSGGRYVSTFMTAEGQPAWTIFDNVESDESARWISVGNGTISEGIG